IGLDELRQLSSTLLSQTHPLRDYLCPDGITAEVILVKPRIERGGSLTGGYRNTGQHRGNDPGKSRKPQNPVVGRMLKETLHNETFKTHERLAVARLMQTFRHGPARSRKYLAPEPIGIVKVF